MKFNNIYMATLLVFALSLSLYSCASTNQESEPIVTETPKEIETPPAPQKEVPQPAKTEADKEYERSVGNANISKDTFEADKKAILQDIEALNVIMKDKNYEKWLSFIEDDSIKYWSDTKNLAKASELLPKNLKNFKLKSLQDYFNYIFIPSRKGRKIDEIRYISGDSIRAVQIQDNEPIIYYNFRKIGGRWLVELPKLNS